MREIPWFMVDDQMSFHPKVLAAGNEALGMWVRAGSWCQQQLNDGFIPVEMAAALGGVDIAEKLVLAGLWSKVRGGFKFHQWAERQLSKTEIENRRKAKQSAGRKGGVKSGESRRGSKDEAPASAETKQQLQQMLNETGSPVPVPIPKGVNFGGEGYVSSGSPETPPPPGNRDPENPRCPDHTSIPATERGPNCRACGAVRQWCESEPDRRRERMRATNRTQQAAIAECDLCDEKGWLLDDDGLVADPARKHRHEIGETA